MSWITTSDPLALVAINAGQVGTPSMEAAAAGNSRLDTDQRSIVIGEPVPIAFCRRRNGFGGILVSPGASECRFENDTDNDVTAYYLLVISEGQLPGIQKRDIFQGLCRVGAITQTYNRRAGTWTPANVIVARAGFTKPEASYYCGSKGAYAGMTTASFIVTVPNGFDVWKKQVHFYLRGGMQVTRLTDGQFGPSDNFCDLAKWMLLNSGRFPSSLIDNEQLEATADFLEDNDFTCNCWLTESTNYLDFLAEWAPLFLLCESNRAGKRGLRPILPTTGTAINTGTITPVFTFTEDNITTGSVEIQYTSLAERRPFVVQVIWRQQLEDDFGIIRTAEVRFSGTATDGPYESHDLSEFCTRENHAVKVGAHILARRIYTTHTIRFTARPQSNNLLVTQGDIIRVRLTRQTSGGGTSFHDYLYQVQRITKTLSGELSYECVHFPVDAQGRSLIALAVAGTTGSGISLSSNRSGLGCDLNSGTDETLPDEDFSLPDLDIDAGLPIDIGGGGFGDGGFGGGGVVNPNPNDGLDPGVPVGPFNPPPTPGGPPGVPPAGVCANKLLITRRISRIDANGDRDPNYPIIVETGGEELYSIPNQPPAPLGLSSWNLTSIDYSIQCVSGEKQDISPVTPVEFDPTFYSYYRYRTTGGSASGWNPTTDPGLAVILGVTKPWWAGGVIEAPLGSAIGGSLGTIRSQSGNAIFAFIVGSVINQPPTVITYTVSGSWEFSNSNSGDDVLAVWLGTGDPP
jgi:hypothetical protein